MIDHAQVARDVTIAATLTGTRAALRVNTTWTSVSAADDAALHAALIGRAAVVADAIGVPVQMTISTDGHDVVLLVATDGETEVIDALLRERRSRRSGGSRRPGLPLPASLLAAAVVTAAVVPVGILLTDGASSGPSPDAAVADARPTVDRSRPPATFPDRGTPRQLLLRDTRVRVVVSAGPARAGGLTPPIPLEESEPVDPAAAPEVVTSAPVAPAPPAPTGPTGPTDHNGGGGGNDDNNDNGPDPDPPEPVDPDDVPDPVDPDDL